MYLCLFAAILLQTPPPNQDKGPTQAIHYYREQDLEKAIQTFLISLEGIHSNTPATPEDQALYEKALTLYLEHGAASAPQLAEELLNQYKQTLIQHPDYHLLEFLVAAAYANQGRFDLFSIIFIRPTNSIPTTILPIKPKLSSISNSWNGLVRNQKDSSNEKKS